MIILSLILAAVSPLATANDYVFARPAVTNAIHGLVMGDTGDYGTMRYEDVAFLKEAFSERAALGNAFGKRQSWFADYFARAETNKVLKSVLINNPQNTLLGDLADAADDFLSPDVELLSSAVVISKQGEVQAKTNFTYTTYALNTNTFNIATNFITQVMTNHTVNVWTNSFLNPFMTNTLVSVTRTNDVVDIDDYILIPGKITYSDSERFKSFSILKKPFLKSVVTNLFMAARELNRLKPFGASFNVNQNNGKRFYRAWEDDEDEPSEDTVTTSGYSVFTTQTSAYRDRQEYQDGEWQSEEGYPKDTLSGYLSSTTPNTLNGKITVSIPMAVVTNKTSSPRITKAVAYALVNVDWTQTVNKESSTESGTSYTEYSSTNQYGTVLFKIGDVSLVNDRESDYVNFSVTIKPGIFADAANAAGVNFLSANQKVDPEDRPDPEWYNESDYRRSKYSTSTKRETFEGSFDIYVVMYINPTTKLQHWSEYQ